MDAATLLRVLVKAREDAALDEIPVVIDGEGSIESVELVFTDGGEIACINLVQA